MNEKDIIYYIADKNTSIEKIGIARIQSLSYGFGSNDNKALIIPLFEDDDEIDEIFEDEIIKNYGNISEKAFKEKYPERLV